MTGEVLLDWLYSLLGNVVLLPIPIGKKGPQFPEWQKLTFAESKASPELLQAARRGGNIGTLLGLASGRLLALDIDRDDLVAEWLAKYPWLANTLRTRGARGCQFWLRLDEGSEYPNGGKAVYPLKEAGEVIGELRIGGASGAQSIIFGVHPAGIHYQIVVEKRPLVISPADLDALAPGLIFGNDPQAESAPAEPASSARAPLPPNIRERVERYLDNCEPAVSGQRGHDTTFRVLCQVINGFDLSPEEALSAALYYNQKCEPPWSEKELKHKVDDALNAQHEKPRGHLLQEDEFGAVRPRGMLDGQIIREQAEAVTKSADADQQAGASTATEHKKKPQLILPSGHISITESATDAFIQLAKTRRYFARGRLVVEVVRNKVLSPLRAIAFRSRMEKDFRLLAWRSPKGEPMLKPAHCPKDIAEAFLESDPAIDLLPGISLLVSSPIVAERKGELVTLNKGYHDLNGGIYVEKRIDIADLQLKEATDSLLGLLADFDFTTGSDKSRAIASFISPALRFGCLLNADFPLDLAEADESQSGKTYRQKVACAIYGEKPYVIARRENGVGSLDESISCALLSGRPFICFENVRGIMDSQILESAIRGHGHVNVRVPHRGEVQLSTERVCWQLSSNQAATTRDLANRSVVTRIRKRPAGYQYQMFPEGDLLTHVQRNCGYYLSCVFSVVGAWFRAGKPRTTEASHDFREWSQSLDWIVQNLFFLPPLLDGHRDEQKRISDPHLNWLRDVAIAVSQSGKLDEGLRPGELVDLAASRGVVVPGYGRHTNDDQQIMLAGRILNKVFSDARVVNVGGFQVRHDQRNEHDYERRREVIRHYYWFEILAEKCASCAPCASS
jgi:Bifunctional DNA primase/polymerase, N-terminal